MVEESWKKRLASYTAQQGVIVSKDIVVMYFNLFAFWISVLFWTCTLKLNNFVNFGRCKLTEINFLVL